MSLKLKINFIESGLSIYLFIQFPSFFSINVEDINEDIYQITLKKKFKNFLNEMKIFVIN